MAEAQATQIARPALRQMAAPLLIVMILAMMVLPLPTIALDLLFTFNIAMSMLVLLMALYVLKPLDFSLFPTVLLITTLLRLSLNVASTRVVLLNGHNGPDAAGKVIEAFGHFLVGNNYVVGIIVFVILVIINFVVITKGAGRIAEVAARFTLDAMPGKQMAIDADLNAGLIGEADARRRRSEVGQGGRVLRRDGRRQQVRARRRDRRHHHHAHQHRRRLDHRRVPARAGHRHRRAELHPAHDRRWPGGAGARVGHLHCGRHPGHAGLGRAGPQPATAGSAGRPPAGASTSSPRSSAFSA